MDPATHSLTGLALSRAGLGRFCPNAPWLLLIAANIPDLDIPIAWGEALHYLESHRGLSHSFTALPFLALIPMLVVGLARRKNFPWLSAYLVSFLGVLSHILIDSTNTFGVQLFTPFRAGWFHLDIIQPFDPWITGMLFLAFAWPLLGRLVTAEIGSKSTPGKGFARFALLFFLCYDYGRFVLHARAIDVLNSRVYDGQAPRQALALPAFANPFQWRGLVRLDKSWQVQHVNLLGDFDPGTGTVFYQAEPSPLLDAAAATSTFRRFLAFNQAPLWTLTQDPDPTRGSAARVIDLRFGDPGEGEYECTALFDSSGKLTKEWFQFGSPETPPFRFR